MMDYAKHTSKDKWYANPVSGDMSFDSFQRFENNPVFVGEEPYLWPVNGTLFKDKKSGDYFIYASCYFKGYWPKSEDEGAIHVKALRSKDLKTFENLGVVVKGHSENFFDALDGRTGGAADLHLTYDEDSDKYYGLIGFANYKNSAGGVACVISDSPCGPFEYAKDPIYTDKDTELFEKYYHRVYACSLIKRKNDWLIVGMCSTPKNQGGTWALCYMTSKHPDRDFSKPSLIFSPQDMDFCSNISEFFPAFCDENYIYLAFTSVALNRSFQLLYKVPIEKATDKKEYQVLHYGSIWHNELTEHEKMGIWGQAIAGLLEGERLTVLYPAMSEHSVGSLNLASATFNDIAKGENAVLSSSAADSTSFVKEFYRDFSLSCSLDFEGEGAELFFGFDNVIEYTGISAATCLDNKVTDKLSKLIFKNNKVFFKKGNNELFIGEKDGKYFSFRLTKKDGNLYYNSKKIGTDDSCGAIGFTAKKGTKLTLKSLKIRGKKYPCLIKLGVTDGLMGAGMGYEIENKDNNDWLQDDTGVYYSNSPDAILKFNFYGVPNRFCYQRGAFDVYYDGEPVSRTKDKSGGEVVFDKSRCGYHAVFIKAKEQGSIPLFLEISAT